MKSVLCFLIILFNISSLAGQTFDVEAIKVSGDNDKRINLVFMGDGYTLFELDKFVTDATNFSNSLFSQSPFSEYADYFNVYAIKVPSNDSGTDHPGTATDVTEPVFSVASKNTYFNTSFDTANIHRLLYTYSSSIVYNVLADNFPQYDQPIIIVNTSEYGGAGGPYATSSTGNNADEIVIHEIGHSLFDLKDEYYPGDALASEAINMTQETNPAIVGWKNWVGTDGVGIYQHSGSGNATSWYRPHQNCKMRYLGVPFCSVCKEGIIEKIHSLVSPIDSYIPNSATVDNPTLPLDFQLKLIKPNPNTLESEWTLNGSSFATNVDDISIEETDLVEGANLLTTVVHDNSTFLRVDNHDSFHIYTVNWNINYTSLGIEEVESNTDTFNISLYPNPTENLLNLKFESSKTSNLKVVILTVDGKKVKSVKLNNYENKQVRLNHLDTGIYIVNFYNNNTLLTTKKLVKK